MATRNYGNGRVYQRGKRWWIAYFADGRERRESCGADVTTKTAAQKKLRERLRAADLGLPHTTATIGDLLDLFLADQRNQARKSIGDAGRRAERIRVALGHLRAAEVTAKHVARFVNQLQEDGRSGPTINRYRSVWQRAFRLGSDMGLAFRAPYWPRYAESPPKRDPISRAAYEQLREHLVGPYRAIAVAAYWTGCRQGELRTWRWENVDLDRRTALIPDSKSGRPRVVPFGSEVYRELLLLGLRRESDWAASPWVFTLDGRGPLAKGALRSAWLRACKKAGLPRLRFHAFRHTAISEMRAVGVEEGAAMAITGHRTRAVFDRYGIQSEAKLREAIEKRESDIRTEPGQSTRPTAPTDAIQ